MFSKVCLVLVIGIVVGVGSGFSATVENPMTSNLNGGGYDISNVTNLDITNTFDIGRTDTEGFYPIIKLIGRQIYDGAPDGRISFFNYWGGTDYEVARIQSVMQPSGASGGILQFWTAPNGWPLATRLQIGENGTILTGGLTNDNGIAGAGGIGIPYGVDYGGMNIAGSIVRPLVGIRTIAGTNDVITLGYQSGSPVAIGTPGTMGGVQAYELVLQNNSSIKFPNAAGNNVGDVLTVDTVDITRLGSVRQTVAQNSVISLGTNIEGILFIMVDEDNTQAMYSMRGQGNTTTEMSDPVNIFSQTAGTANSINIYYSAANSRYELQNKRGGGRTIGLVLIGTKS